MTKSNPRKKENIVHVFDLDEAEQNILFFGELEQKAIGSLTDSVDIFIQGQLFDKAEDSEPVTFRFE